MIEQGIWRLATWLDMGRLVCFAVDTRASVAYRARSLHYFDDFMFWRLWWITRGSQNSLGGIRRLRPAVTHLIDGCVLLVSQ